MLWIESVTDGRNVIGFSVNLVAATLKILPARPVFIAK